MKPDWIIFDIGGVFLNWHSCRDNFLKSFNLDLATFDLVFNKYINQMNLGEITPEYGFECILKDLNINKDSKQALSEWVNHLTPITPTISLINKLKTYYQLGICTNNWLGVLDRSRQLFPDVYQNFITIVDSSAVNAVKPHIKIYQQVELLTKAKGQKIFFIDDTFENTESAEKFGWQTFLFNSKTDNGIYSCQQLSEILIPPKG